MNNLHRFTRSYLAGCYVYCLLLLRKVLFAKSTWWTFLLLMPELLSQFCWERRVNVMWSVVGIVTNAAFSPEWVISDCLK